MSFRPADALRSRRPISPSILAADADGRAARLSEIEARAMLICLLKKIWREGERETGEREERDKEQNEFSFFPLSQFDGKVLTIGTATGERRS